MLGVCLTNTDCSDVATAGSCYDGQHSPGARQPVILLCPYCAAYSALTMLHILPLLCCIFCPYCAAYSVLTVLHILPLPCCIFCLISCCIFCPYHAEGLHILPYIMLHILPLLCRKFCPFQDREHLSSSISRQTSQSQHFKTNISVPVVQDRHLSPSIPRVETNISVPVFDDAIPAGSGHLGRFMGVPEDTDADVVVSLELAVQLGALPVPHIHLAISIPAGNVAGTHRVKKHLLHCPEKNGLSHNSGFSITFFPFF